MQTKGSGNIFIFFSFNILIVYIRGNVKAKHKKASNKATGNHYQVSQGKCGALGFFRKNKVNLIFNSF